MVTLKFHDVNPEYEKRLIEIGTNQFDEDKKPTLIRFEIHYGNDGDWEYIDLDKSTAIKFSKELRKQIALLD
jgi:hypothetical protein